MHRASKLSSVQICEDIGPIRYLQFHPKFYTALITTDKHLVLYDLFSLKLVWSMELQALHFPIAPQTKPVAAFTLDFNEVYIANSSGVIRLEYRPKSLEENRFNQPVQTPIKLKWMSASSDNSAPLLLEVYNNGIVVVYREVIVIQELVAQERQSTLHPQLVLRFAKALTELQSMGSVVLLACTDNSILLWRINLPELHLTEIYKMACPSRIASIAFDSIHRRLAILNADLCQVEIYSYGCGVASAGKTPPLPQLTKLTSIKFLHPISSMMFFTFAENTDTVCSRYRQLHLAYSTSANNPAKGASNQFELFLTKIDSPTNQQLPTGLITSSQDISFNPLFNNCVISKTSTGQLTLTNLYGYDKEWVNLGFRFVSLERNEIYFEKEDDFQYEIQKKRTIITREELDDYTYSLLSEDELQNQHTPRVKRIKFDI